MPLPIPAPDYPPETIARIRELYAQGVTLADIESETGVGRYGIYYWVDGGPADGPRALPPLPRRRNIAPRDRRRLSGNREQLVRRLWRTAEAQVRDIEDRLIAAEQEPVERERDARMLAVLVKTLRELAAFDEANAAKPASTRTESDDDDPVPRDIDEFRRELGT